MSKPMSKEMRSFAWTFVIFFGTMIITAIVLAAIWLPWWVAVSVPFAILAVGFARRAMMGGTAPSGRRR